MIEPIVGVILLLIYTLVVLYVLIKIDTQEG